MVETSNAAMAAVRSEILLVVRDPLPLDGEAAPPPCRLGLLALDRTFGSMSERTGPEADGGALEDGAGMGECAREDAEDPGADKACVWDNGFLAAM